MTDLVRALKHGWPEAQWTLNGDDYAGLVWEGPGDKPSLAQIDAAAAQAEIAALPAYAALKRWEKEVGGITVGGMPIYTDDRSKMMIMGARIKAASDPQFTTQWKAANGAFVTIDAPTLIAVSDAVLGHVDACFTIEDQVLAGIAAEEITTTDEIDAAFD